MIARFSVIPLLEKVAIAFALSLALFLAALAAFLYWYWNTYIEDYQDWPPLTMTYSETSGDTVYRLTHRTKTDWREEITRDPLMPTMVGSYHEVGDGQVRSFYAETGELETSPGSFILPWGMHPVPFAVLKVSYLDIPTRVRTDTRLCFEGKCEDNAWGWRFDDHIYADDMRGIPIGDGIDNIAITEVLVHAPQEPTGK